MKRDARIGLAVVLFLGLMVTLLVGRAIYNRSDYTADMEGSLPALENSGATATTADEHLSAHVPANTGTPVDSLAGNSPVQTLPPSQMDALNRFSANEGTAVQPAPVQFPHRAGAPTVSDTPVTPAPFVPQPTPSPTPVTHGDRGTPPVANPDMLDHDLSPVTPTSGGADAAPADGYGYTVKSGDNIWKISTDVFGDSKFTQKIVEANKGVDLKKLKIGQIIKIPVIANKSLLVKLPSLADAKAGKPAAQPQPTGPLPTSRTVSAPPTVEAEAEAATRVHKVASGESLSAIAQKYYGASGPKTIAKIMSANKGLDAARLKVGQEINLPAK